MFCGMSQDFEINERTLWNPSNGPGLLFVRMAAALEPVAELPSGIGPGRWADCHEIDLPALTAFTDALVRIYRSSNHVIFRSLMEGFIATAIVLVQRGGGTVTALAEQAGAVTSNVQVGPNGPVATPEDRLAELAAAHDGSMAW